MVKITGKNVLVDRFPYGGLIPAPAVSPATLKHHLQVTHNFDDAIIQDIGGYLQAATEQAEDRGSVALIRQRRIQSIDTENPDKIIYNSIKFIRGPIISVTAVKYLNASGQETTLASSNYRVAPLFDNSIYFLQPLPELAPGPSSLWVEYEAGYGDSSESVPANWQSIVMTIAMRLYDYRGGDSGASNDSWERMIHRMVRNAGDSVEHA